MEEFSVSESQDLGSVYGPLMRIIESDTLAYRVIFAKTLKSPTAAIVLSQYLYWGRNLSSVKRDGWFYKTEDQFYDETGVSGKSQRTARKNLIENRILLLEKRGVPAKNWYKINYEGLATFLFKHAPPVTAWELQDTPDEDSKKSPTGTSGGSESVALSITESTTESTTVSAKPKTFSNFRDQRRIETGRLPMLRAKKTIKSKKAWDELSEVDYEFKRYRGRAESKTGEDYSLLDDSLNPQMKRLMALAISKVSKQGKVMDDFYEYIFERSEYARKQKYNPLVCLTDRMLVDWQMESIKVKETLEDAALRIAKEERLRWPDDSDQARMSAANRFGEVSGILTTDPEWWEKIKPYRKLLGY